MSELKKKMFPVPARFIFWGRLSFLFFCHLLTRKVRLRPVSYFLQSHCKGFSAYHRSLSKKSFVRFNVIVIWRGAFKKVFTSIWLTHFNCPGEVDLCRQVYTTGHPCSTYNHRQCCVMFTTVRKNDCFCSLRMWKELNIKGLTSLKMCVSPIQILLFWTSLSIVGWSYFELGRPAWPTRSLRLRNRRI